MSAETKLLYAEALYPHEDYVKKGTFAYVLSPEIVDLINAANPKVLKALQPQKVSSFININGDRLHDGRQLTDHFSEDAVIVYVGIDYYTESKKEATQLLVELQQNPDIQKLEEPLGFITWR